MNRQKLSFHFTAAVAGFIFLSALATTQAQQGAVTKVAGTIQGFAPDSNQMLVQPDKGSPVAYACTKNTVFVDASGNAINREMIQPGEQTTVYCTKEGNQLVVTKVVCSNFENPIFGRCHHPITW